MKVTFDLAVKIQSLNPGMRRNLKTLRKARAHQFAHRRRIAKQREMAHFAVVGLTTRGTRVALRGAERLVITLTRLGRGTLDDDNLAAGFKAVRDGIAAALELDDRDPMLRWRYAQERFAGYQARVDFETMTKLEFAQALAAAEAVTP